MMMMMMRSMLEHQVYGLWSRAKFINITMNECQFTGLVSEDSDDDTLKGNDENDSDEEEYHDSSSILDNDKSRESGDGLKMYLQKNCRCFDVQRSGKGRNSIHVRD